MKFNVDSENPVCDLVLKWDVVVVAVDFYVEFGLKLDLKLDFGVGLLLIEFAVVDEFGVAAPVVVRVKFVELF